MRKPHLFFFFCFFISRSINKNKKNKKKTEKFSVGKLHFGKLFYIRDLGSLQGHENGIGELRGERGGEGKMKSKQTNMSNNQNLQGIGPIHSIFPDVQAFLLLMNSPLQPHSPQFNYVYTNSSNTSFAVETVPCQKMCLCDSCSESCHAVVPTYGQCTIFGLPCFASGLIGIAVLAIVVMAAVAFSITQRVFDAIKQKRSSSKKTSKRTKWKNSLALGNAVFLSLVSFFSFFFFLLSVIVLLYN